METANEEVVFNENVSIIDDSEEEEDMVPVTPHVTRRSGLSVVTPGNPDRTPAKLREQRMTLCEDLLDDDDLSYLLTILERHDIIQSYNHISGGYGGPNTVELFLKGIMESIKTLIISSAIFDLQNVGLEKTLFQRVDVLEVFSNLIFFDFESEEDTISTLTGNCDVYYAVIEIFFALLTTKLGFLLFWTNTVVLDYFTLFFDICLHKGHPDLDSLGGHHAVLARNLPVKQMNDIWACIQKIVPVLFQYYTLFTDQKQLIVRVIDICKPLLGTVLFNDTNTEHPMLIRRACRFMEAISMHIDELPPVDTHDIGSAMCLALPATLALATCARGSKPPSAMLKEIKSLVELLVSTLSVFTVADACPIVVKTLRSLCRQVPKGTEYLRSAASSFCMVLALFLPESVEGTDYVDCVSGVQSLLTDMSSFRAASFRQLSIEIAIIGCKNADIRKHFLPTFLEYLSHRLYDKSGMIRRLSLKAISQSVQLLDTTMEFDIEAAVKQVIPLLIDANATVRVEALKLVNYFVQATTIDLELLTFVATRCTDVRPTVRQQALLVIENALWRTPSEKRALLWLECVSMLVDDSDDKTLRLAFSSVGKILFTCFGTESERLLRVRDVLIPVVTYSQSTLVFTCARFLKEQKKINRKTFISIQNFCAWIFAENDLPINYGIGPFICLQSLIQYYPQHADIVYLLKHIQDALENSMWDLAKILCLIVASIPEDLLVERDDLVALSNFAVYVLENMFTFDFLVIKPLCVLLQTCGVKQSGRNNELTITELATNCQEILVNSMLRNSNETDAIETELISKALLIVGSLAAVYQIHLQSSMRECLFYGCLPSLMLTFAEETHFSTLPNEEKEKVQLYAIVALGSACIPSNNQKFVLDVITTLVSLLNNENTPVPVITNCLVVLSDVASTFTSEVDRYQRSITAHLHHPNSVVRRTALLVLGRLAADGFVKMKEEILFQLLFLLGSNSAETKSLAYKLLFSLAEGAVDQEIVRYFSEFVAYMNYFRSNLSVSQQIVVLDRTRYLYGSENLVYRQKIYDAIIESLDSSDHFKIIAHIFQSFFKSFIEGKVTFNFRSDLEVEQVKNEAFLNVLHDCLYIFTMLDLKILKDASLSTPTMTNIREDVETVGEREAEEKAAKMIALLVEKSVVYSVVQESVLPDLLELRTRIRAEPRLSVLNDILIKCFCHIAQVIPEQLQHLKDENPTLHDEIKYEISEMKKIEKKNNDIEQKTEKEALPEPQFAPDMLGEEDVSIIEEVVPKTPRKVAESLVEAGVVGDLNNLVPNVRKMQAIPLSSDEEDL
ncbi:hypothetical protein PCE1_003170 [Barthelona sp. PCE]